MDKSTTNWAGNVAIFGALSYDVIAAACSSPQTTELNAEARSETLMKWVYIGLAQVALFALIGIALQKAQGEPIWPPIVGCLLGGGLMYASYVHARRAGLANPGEPTEDYQRRG